MRIWKEFTFDAAHRLPNVPVGHPCARLHGHTYRLRVYLEGKLDPNLGWIVDFADIKQSIQPILDQLDHHYLNEIPGLQNPTAEILAKWIYHFAFGTYLSPFMVGVELFESSTTGVWYDGT